MLLLRRGGETKSTATAKCHFAEKLNLLLIPAVLFYVFTEK